MALGTSEVARIFEHALFSGEKVYSFHQILKEIPYPQSQTYKATKQTYALKINYLPLDMFHV